MFDSILRVIELNELIPFDFGEHWLLSFLYLRQAMINLPFYILI